MWRSFRQPFQRPEGNEPVLSAVDPFDLLWSKAHRRARPDISRWCFAEIGPIAGERAFVHLPMFAALLTAAFGRLVVQRPAQCLFAEAIPIGAGVREMQVPGLVNFLRRTGDVI